MKPVEKWKSWTFIGSLAVIAVITNGLVAPRPADRPRQAQAPERPQPPTVQEADQARLIERNLNAVPTRTLGTKSIAIVAATESGRPNSIIANFLAERVRGGQIKTLTSLFTPEFISEGLFKATFEDSPKSIDHLKLRDGLDLILLAQQTVEYTTDPSLENVITASMTLEVKLVSVTQRGESQAWTFTSSGAGFNQADARKAAEERILKQLSIDTKISAAILP